MMWNEKMFRKQYPKCWNKTKCIINIFSFKAYFVVAVDSHDELS